MTQALQKLVTFDEFVEFLKTQSETIRYELYDGDIIQMPQPKGKHEEIIAFLAAILGYEFVRLKLKYGISNKALVQPGNKHSGYFADILVMNLANLVNEPRWQEESILTQHESIPLVIEVVMKGKDPQRRLNRDSFVKILKSTASYNGLTLSKADINRYRLQAETGFGAAADFPFVRPSGVFMKTKPVSPEQYYFGSGLIDAEAALDKVKP